MTIDEENVCYRQRLTPSCGLLTPDLTGKKRKIINVYKGADGLTACTGGKSPYTHLRSR